MKRAKAFVAVLAATTMVLGLVGCGSSSDKSRYFKIRKYIRILLIFRPECNA